MDFCIDKIFHRESALRQSVKSTLVKTSKCLEEALFLYICKRNSSLTQGCLHAEHGGIAALSGYANEKNN
jgi:hypothetical protein